MKHLPSIYVLLLPALASATYYYSPGGYSYTSYTRHGPTLLTRASTYPVASTYQQPSYHGVVYPLYKVWPTSTSAVASLGHAGPVFTTIPCVTPVAATFSHFHLYHQASTPLKVKTNDTNKTEHVFKPQFKWYQPFWSYEGSIQHFPTVKMAGEGGAKAMEQASKDMASTTTATTTSTTTTAEKAEEEEKKKEASMEEEEEEVKMIKAEMKAAQRSVKKAKREREPTTSTTAKPEAEDSADE